MPTRFFWALGILAGVFFLVSAEPAAAQNEPCTLRCTTIHQFFDDELASIIPLTCDAEARRCTGKGALRINGENVPTLVTGTFAGIALMLKIDTAHGVLTGGRPVDTMGAAPDGTFQVVLGSAPEPQAKRVALRWFILKTPSGQNVRLEQNVGGHLNVLINNYMPAPNAPAGRAAPL